MSHIGSCFCGAVKVEVTGPVNAFSLWNPEDVRVTSGAEHVATFQKTKMSKRQYCKKCGGHLMNRKSSRVSFLKTDRQAVGCGTL